MHVCEGGKGRLKVSSKTNLEAFGLAHLVAVMHGGDYLSKEVAGLPLAQASALADVVVQLALAGVLHHDHDLVLVLEHCENTRDRWSQFMSPFREINRSILMEGNRAPAG